MNKSHGITTTRHDTTQQQQHTACQAGQSTRVVNSATRLTLGQRLPASAATHCQSAKSCCHVLTVCTGTTGRRRHSLTAPTTTQRKHTSEGQRRVPAPSPSTERQTAHVAASAATNHTSIASHAYSEAADMHLTR